LWSLRRPGRSWYAQDRDGNVWSFGEDTKELEGGKVVKTEGSWEAGKDGALPGIIMEADPQVGDRYRQEYYEGEAEDMAEVLSVDERTTVPHGSFEGVLETKDWTPLEPGIVEHKHYARGVGTIHKEKVEGETGHLDLLEMTEGSTQAEAAPPPGEDEDTTKGTRRTPPAGRRSTPTPGSSPLRAGPGPWPDPPVRPAPWSGPG
jgi:hypothetical protein